jgi:imidazolonepropionase-like amidohydrolase
MNESVLNNWVKAKNNIMADPLYDSAGAVALIALRKKILKACSDNDVGIVSGSDAPQVFDVPGFSLHQELKYMADAGLTPFEVLQTSTVNAGAYFNNPGSGVIKPGSVSDLVLLNGNPLNDITQTSSIAGVMIGKQWLPQDVIAQRLEALKGKIKQ